MTNGEFIRRELINIINNADYELLDRILGNCDEVEEIYSFARKMYRQLDAYIKEKNGLGDLDDDVLFDKLVKDWYLERCVIPRMCYRVYICFSINIRFSSSYKFRYSIAGKLFINQSSYYNHRCIKTQTDYVFRLYNVNQ